MGDAQYSNFQKLKLQVAVAQKQERKLHKVAKLEDRLQDVQGYNQLWHEYEKIQTVVRVETTTTTTPQKQPAVEAVSPAAAVAPTSPPSGVVECTEAAITETAAPPPVEYDLAEDLGFRSNKENQNSSQRSLTGSIRSFRSRKSAKTTDDSTTGRSSRRRRRRFRRSSHKDSVQPTEITVNTAAKETNNDKNDPRSESFKLTQTNSWYFDFHDEFEPAGEDGGTTGSNNSQANLSLLSASSLEAQRRYFSEKRRQRGKPKARAGRRTEVPTAAKTASAEEYGFQHQPRDTAAPSIEFELEEIPVAGNLRHKDNSHDYGRLSPAQQLLASKNNPALRQQLANSILKSRNKSLTNMEVAFSSPESGEGDDDASMVSDLDDNVSVTSVGGYSTSGGGGGDYGVTRRRRPSMGSEMDVSGSGYHSRNDYGVRRRHRTQSSQNGDHSIVSASDNDTIGTGGGASQPNAPKYDHNVVLQRRLDIEAKLRALQAEDDDEGDVVVETSDNKAATALAAPPEVAAAAAAAGHDEYTLPPVVSPRAVRSQKRRGNTAGTDYAAVESEYVGSPLHDRKQITPCKINRTAVEGNVPSEQQQHQQKSSTKLNESIDSEESPKARITVPYLGTTTKGRFSVVSPEPDDNDSMIANQSTASMSSTNPSPVLSSEKASSQDESDSMVFVNQSAYSEHEGNEDLAAHDKKGAPVRIESGDNNDGVLDGTRDTLLLAGQVEANVKNILQRYRSATPEISDMERDDEQPPRIVSPQPGWLQ